MNKSLILICLVIHSSLNPLYKGQVELVCILKKVFNIVLDMALLLTLMKVKCYGLKFESDRNSNMICGVVYRHPSSNLETFLNKFYSVIGKINQERKLCFKYLVTLIFDKHSLTEDFINTLSSFFLEPHILKPTRITNHYHMTRTAPRALSLQNY